MGGRQGQREQLRHWLPSQGVDPAPLAELNAECLGLLALRAGDSGDSGAMPGLLSNLRDLWADLPNLAVRRLAHSQSVPSDAHAIPTADCSIA